MQDVSNKVSILNNRTQDRRISTKRNTQYNVGYSSNAIRIDKNSHVISGYFPKQNSVKAVAIKKVNNTLCGLLLCAIIISAISYYFVVASEIKLNDFSRKTTLLNVENAELQNKLDKLKSFNNVDLTMQKSNLLQRPEKVIETTINPEELATKQNKLNIKPKAWAIGY